MREENIVKPYKSRRENSLFYSNNVEQTGYSGQAKTLTRWKYVSGVLGPDSSIC